MRTPALLLTVLVAFLFLNCNSLPPDPATLPENASIKVIAIDVDSQFKQPVKVSEETSIKVTLKLSLPDFIDSISLDIQSTEGEVEYHTSIEKPWDSTTFAVTLQFPSSGTKSLVYTAWISNGMEKTETVIFDVAARFTNASPVLAPKTIELLSEKGVPTTRNLMPYVTDPDNDKITFEIKGQGSVLPFVLKDSLLSSTSELEVGNYVLSIKVSDGILSDAGTILWKVYTPPDGSTQIAADEAETVKNIPVLINVLENDVLPSGSLLSYVSQGKNGKTIIADGKISYTPNSGFTGEDTVLYLVNGEDTGWVYVTVTEPEIENRPPAWAPDTVELYSPEGVVTSINVSPYASDPDNDALTFDVTVPEDADFEVNNSVIASMAEMEAGAYYLLVTVSDGEETIAGMIKWTVFEVKDVEISPVDDSAALEEGGSVVISVLENDEGVDDVEGILITSVTQGTHGSATISGGTSLLYTPESGFSGTDTVMYVVNGSDTGRVIISVIDTDPNTPPQWSTASTAKSSITGITGSLNLESYASDADNDALTFSIASAPEAGFSLQEGTQLSVDAEVAEGEYTIVVTVSDGKASADLTVVWSVFPPAEAELGINDDEAEVVAGNSVTVNVLANDEVVSGEAQLVVTATTSPSHGSVSITDEGIVYSSDVNFQGDDSFLYIVNGTDTGTVTVKVGSAEVTVVEDQHSLSENGSITVNVLENDVAPDGLVLVVESVIQGTLGSAIVVDDSTVGYEAGEVSGIDTVRYVLSNGDTGLVVLTIAAIEYTLADDETSVLQGRTREIMVLANDAVNVGTLTVTGVTDASKGSVSFTDSSVLYTAAADADGSDVLTYSVNNGKASAKLTVTFLAIEITASDDSLTIDEDAEAQTVAVLENDAITEGETMTLTAVSQAQLGTVAIDETNKKVVYTPAEDSSGTEIITYTINDAIDGTLKIVINPVNDVPEFTTTADNPTVAEGTKDTIIFSAIDADGTPVAFSLDGAPEWVTTSGGTNSIEIIFAPGYSVASADDSTATFTLLGVSGEDTLRRDIGATVTNVNTAPVFTSPATTIEVYEGATETTLFKATDAEGDNLTYSVVSTLPSWITSSTNNGISLIVAPEYDDVGPSASSVSEDVTLSVTDGTEAKTHMVKVTANAAYRLTVNRLPTAGGTVHIVKDTAAYPSGTQVSLSVTPKSGYRFNGWSGDTTVAKENTSLTITMKKDRVITANFTRQFTLTMTSSTGGTVKPTGSMVLDSGSTRTITAEYDEGYLFRQWSTTASGVVFGSSTAASTTVSLTKADATVKAEFKCITFKKKYEFSQYSYCEFKDILQTEDGGYLIIVKTNDRSLLFRLDQSGDSVWVKETYLEKSEAIEKVADNRYVIAGSDMTGSSPDYSELNCYAQNGANAWSYAHTSRTESNFGSIALPTNDGGYILAGHSNARYLLVKLTSARIAVWDNVYAAGGQVHGCIPTRDGGYLMVGSSGMGPAPQATKTNSVGKEIWTNSFKAAYLTDYSTACFYSVDTTSDGDCIIAGEGNINGELRGFLIKVALNGTVEKFSEFNDASRMRSVKVLNDGGDYILAGATKAQGTNGSEDLYIIRVNSSGTIVSEYVYGDGDEQFGWNLNLTSDGGAIVIGSDQNGQTGWIVKTDENGQVED